MYVRHAEFIIMSDDDSCQDHVCRSSEDKAAAAAEDQSEAVCTEGLRLHSDVTVMSQGMVHCGILTELSTFAV